MFYAVRQNCYAFIIRLFRSSKTIIPDWMLDSIAMDVEISRQAPSGDQLP